MSVGALVAHIIQEQQRQNDRERQLKDAELLRRYRAGQTLSWTEKDYIERELRTGRLK